MSPGPTLNHTLIVSDIHRAFNRADGETIKLPEPFGLEIPTDEWEPWDD